MILIARFLIPRKYNGMAIYPFIFVKSRSSANNSILINHERIHLKQQVELLWVFFFVWYIIEFLIHLIKLKNWNKAYHNISFEKEAYQNEDNFYYLEDRKIWAFIKFYN